MKFFKFVSHKKALPLGGWLCDVGFDDGWGSVFYLFGLVGIVWSVLMMLLNADTPQTHKFISVTERDYILDSIGGFSANKEVFFGNQIN